MIHQGYSSLTYDELMLYDETQRLSRQMVQEHEIHQWGHVHACALNHVTLSATPWTAAHQAPLFKEFSRQEYQSGFPHPPSGIFPTQGLGTLIFWVSCTGWQILHHCTTWEAQWGHIIIYKYLKKLTSVINQRNEQTAMKSQFNLAI